MTELTAAMSQRLATTLFLEWSTTPPPLLRALNRLLRRRPLWLRLERAIDGRYDVTTVEQRIHLVHLLTYVVCHDAEGDVVEIGTIEGKTAVLLTKVLQELNSTKRLHVYAAFHVSYFLGEGADVLARLRGNFAATNARLPEIHRGYFKQTLPRELPEKISFVHLDVGIGPNPGRHNATRLHCLASIYDRLSPGGVCVLMDYHDGSFPDVPDGHPGVGLVTDEFLRGGPEKPFVLYGGQGAMAYFRRVGRVAVEKTNAGKTAAALAA
jgi:O-methyltransferase